MALVKACARCRKLIPHGMAYCETCAPIAEAENKARREERAEYMRKKYNRQYNKRRDPKYQSFYRSKAWRETSRAKLQAAGYKCEAKLGGCTRLAVEVHHVKPIQTDEGWDLRLAWGNLEALCTACHNGRHPEKGKRKHEDGVLDLREISRNL